ncbi:MULTISPECIES: DUF305 domain-containing protein [Chitinophagaceae]|uniref:DUF305 domain-containing protein n=1 Tax=Chitinophagaceae TaxID=563835 RepID=UPI000F50E867|nr:MULTISPECIES: DUF305 domain-containing protein [Chitinophagaceae]RPD51137.1 DUF305 domain-containing protein [Paracnuella aquatica]
MNKMWVISLAVLLAACASNSSTDTNNADTAGHSGHTNSAAATADTSTTATAGGNAMMDLHQVMNDAMQQMKKMQSTGDADHDFTMMMKRHHQSAVDMAKIEVSNGADAQMKAMAQKMIDDQQREISQFDAFLQNHLPSGRSDYGKGVVGMMTEMSQMKMEGGTLDAMFASMMIPHHQDAVKMAEAYMKEAKNAELK